MTYRIGPRRLATLLAALFATVAAAVSIRAGSLEPPGPPAPTMKTLDEIPPVLSRRLDATNGDADGCNSTRFTCLWGNVAVLDNETGLVWERTATSILSGQKTWQNARLCSLTGSRGGWRLPSIHELATVGANLPAQAPFILPPGGTSFWTLTTNAVNTERAWTGHTPTASTFFSWTTVRKDQQRHYWCVRSTVPLTEY